MGASVIDDTLTGGARWMHNLGPEPVWVETKTQFQQELRSRGLRLADTKSYSRDDKSPYATRTRLRLDKIDPFVDRADGGFVQRFRDRREDHLHRRTRIDNDRQE